MLPLITDFDAGDIVIIDTDPQYTKDADGTPYIITSGVYEITRLKMGMVEIRDRLGMTAWLDYYAIKSIEKYDPPKTSGGNAEKTYIKNNPNAKWD